MLPGTEVAASDPDRERLARVALSCLIEPGNHPLGMLVDDIGAVAALAAVCPAAGSREGSIPSGAVERNRLAATAAVRLHGEDPYRLARRTLEHTARLGARVITPADDEWPGRLDDLRGISAPGTDRIREDTYPPMCLWIRGRDDLDGCVDRSVSVVGARAATGYGNHVATDLAFGLATRGWAVVSGGAFGIDAAAHRGTLAAGGTTVAVLACGIDRPYPAGNTSLFERICEQGLLISEWPPGTEPHRHRFLIRNRVIAALSPGTVMVEASARSGARQTLGLAIQLGRVGMVIPGPVTSAMSIGCHAALRHWNARPVTTAAEVIEEVGRFGESSAPVPRGRTDPRDLLDPASQQVLDAVRPRHPGSVDEIAGIAGVPLRQALESLALLEAGNFVTRRSGGFVLAAPRTVRTGPSVPA